MGAAETLLKPPASIAELKERVAKRRKEVGLRRLGEEVDLDPATIARFLVGEKCHPGTEAALRAVFDPAEGRVRG